MEREFQAQYILLKRSQRNAVTAFYIIIFKPSSLRTTLSKTTLFLCPAPSTLPFNKRSVCFASVLSPLLFVGEGLAPPVAPILVVFTNLCNRTLITCLARPSRCIVVIDFLSVFNLSIINSGLQSNFHFNILT